MNPGHISVIWGGMREGKREKEGGRQGGRDGWEEKEGKQELLCIFKCVRDSERKVHGGFDIFLWKISNPLALII